MREHAISGELHRLLAMILTSPQLLSIVWLNTLSIIVKGMSHTGGSHSTVIHAYIARSSLNRFAASEFNRRF
ncbi:hypothetical protein BDR04DRAFT_211329 [Suillus decipiens]|nr:hypothetical protein BDR04DRAFT_211329 [Suillus decipiens]